MYNRYPYHTAIAIIAMIFILINSNLFAYDDWELVKGPFCGHFTCFGEDLNKKLFAGSWGDGLYQLSSDGSTWTKVSTNLADPYITCMFIDSTNKIYVGTYGNGVNVSSNSGVNWTQLSSGISNLKIKAIIKNVNNQLLAATNGSGVFRSTNNGTSWIESNSGLWFRDVNALLLCRNGIIIAATNGGGFYNSTDGGISWRKANTKTTITNSNLDYAYKMILQTDGSVYASSPNRGVIYSIDNGLSWDEQDTTGMPTFNTYALAFDHERYVIAGTRFNGIYFHNDLVYSTWTQSDMKSYGPEAIIRASNGKHYAAIPMKGIYRSIDDGIHWTKHSFGMKNYGLMGLTAYKNGIIYAGRETGGAFLSTDYGKNWAAAGLDTFMIRTFAFDSSGNVLAGTIHGIYKSTNNGLNWSLFGLKDSLINHISIASNGVIFANAPDLYKSTNGGTSWSVIVIVTGPKGDPIPATVAAINRNNDAYASVSGFGIYKAPNLGAWTISNNNLYAQTENLNIYFNYSGHIYTASSWGGMYISTNNGTSWNRDTLGLLSHRVSEIALNSIDIPYVALTDGSGIYSKISTNKWRSANSNIMYADYLTIASSGNGNIYVCTDAVYMTRDSNKLSIPTLLSPASGTTEIDVLPQLTWTAVQDVEAYEFQISDAEDFSAIVEYRTQLQNSVNIERDLYFSTQYFWRVRSKYNNHVSEWSNVSSFVTIFPPPVLIYPANNARGIRKNHNLLWHSIDSTARYEYQVSIDSTFSSIASTQANLTDTSAPVSLKDYTHYYWRARHANKYGVKSPWSNYNAYLTAVAPPVLKSPPDQSANLDTVVVMTWDTSVASTKYIILISKSPDFSPDSIIYEGTTDENNRHRMPLLQFNKTYWWKIKAGNDDGYGEFCDPWSYTTGIKVPLLASPADSVTNQPINLTIKWNNLINDAKQHLQVSKDPTFKTFLINDSSLSAVSYDLKNLEYYTKYYWRASNVKGSIQSFWSSTWAFKTTIPTPVAVYPAKGDTTKFPLNFNISWNQVPNATLYHFQISTDPTFADIVKDTSNMVDIFIKMDSTLLKYNTTYYCHVDAKNKDSQTPYSEIFSFTTKSNINKSVRDNIPEIGSLSAYPNPFAGELRITLNLKKAARVNMSIVDISGNIVEIITNNALNIGNNELIWKPEHLSQGKYFLNAEIDGTLLSRELIYLK